MGVLPPINMARWIEDNRQYLQPPVMNRVVYEDTGNFIVMVVGGPNARKDFHTNTTEELFYQIEGTIEVTLRIVGTSVKYNVGPGELFLVPAGTPHSPKRFTGTAGLVVELKRPQEILDTFSWHCERCDTLLYAAQIPVQDIVKDLPVVMQTFWANLKVRTCSSCGQVMEEPLSTAK